MASQSQVPVDHLPELSIVVTSTSLVRLPDITSLLDSLSLQVNRDFEVVFVNEGPDELLEEVKQHCTRRGLRGCFERNTGPKGLSQGRNVGIKLSRGKVVAMIDDDVVLPEKWTAAVMDALDTDSRVIGITGPAYPLWDNDELKWLPREYYWLVSCTGWIEFRNPRDVRSAWGMNMAFRREAFDKVGGLLDLSGYHKPIAEDLEFSLRVRRKTGKRIAYCREAFVWHRVHPYRLTWTFIGERSRHIGTSRYVLARLGVSLDREMALLTRTFMGVTSAIAKNRQKRLRIFALALFVASNILMGYLFAILKLDDTVGPLLQHIQDSGLANNSNLVERRN